MGNLRYASSVFLAGIFTQLIWCSWICAL
jgi:hypothetical protein